MYHLPGLLINPLLDIIIFITTLFLPQMQAFGQKTPANSRVYIS